ncbi:MAG: SDR family oxidoreductase [Dehalococcoidia bacterium]|nr:SDR family oxidoreductase [Dehalococcoidia bacterium]
MTKQSVSGVFDLSGKSAIVTGGARGIGQAIAFRLADAGAGVIVSDIDADGAKQTAEAIKSRGGKADCIRADACRMEDAGKTVKAALDAFGRLDILVNNAGIVESHSPFLQTTEERWDKILDTNLKGTFFYSQAAGRQMIKAGRGGRIINMASVEGFQPRPNNAVYDISKAGVVMLTKSLALALASEKILVNAIAPGGISTPGVDKVLAGFAAGAGADIETVKKAGAAKMILGRWGESDDVAGAALFLASGAASYMTGSVVVVDGGFLLT